MRVDWMQPHPARLDPSRPDHHAIMAVHDAAVAAGEAGYREPATGYWVFTAAALAARPCCGQGCRHCPWVGGGAQPAQP